MPAISQALCGAGSYYIQMGWASVHLFIHPTNSAIYVTPTLHQASGPKERQFRREQRERGPFSCGAYILVKETVIVKCHKEIKPRGMEAMTGYWCNLKEAGQGRPLEEMTYELQTKWGASHQKIQGKNIPEGENSLYKCPGGRNGLSVLEKQKGVRRQWQ